MTRPTPIRPARPGPQSSAASQAPAILAAQDQRGTDGPRPATEKGSLNG